MPTRDGEDRSNNWKLLKVFKRFDSETVLDTMEEILDRVDTISSETNNLASLLNEGTVVTSISQQCDLCCLYLKQGIQVRRIVVPSFVPWEWLRWTKKRMEDEQQ